ncbi:MAG: 2OG-Fe(II) oxygenase family protein [Gammaproteobacteria bacterium]
MEMKDYFAVYENQLSPEVCRDIITRFEADSRKVKGMVGRGDKGVVDPSVKATTELLLWTSREGWEDVNDALLSSLKACLAEYMTSFGPAFPIALAPEEPRITRYKAGEGFLQWHSDNIGRSPTRVLTAIWYLNTVKRGGETHYPWQDIAIAPVEGRLVLCPVGWPFMHRGNPPVGGPKYILITQLHQEVRKPVASAHQRAEA